jgi:Ca2+-binding RTX toxin-like protein
LLQDAHLFLGDGDDTAVVHSAPATVLGEGGNDELTALCPTFGCSAHGWNGADIITGFPVVFSGRGNDTITGTELRDVLVASSGDDTIDAGAGADFIHPSHGHDTVDGGEGNDLLDLPEWGFAGADKGVTVDLSAGVATGGSGQDTYALVGIEHVRGTVWDDRLIGNAENNTLLGGRHGEDVLIGGGGNDSLSGGKGDDRLYGQAGRDRLDAYLGADLLVGGPDPDKLFGGAARDTIRARDRARDIVRGGPHIDRAEVDGRDDVAGVEIFFEVAIADSMGAWRGASAPPDI